ncbi:MAG: glycosyltransferase family 2 protein [Prevotellaceae bacterium]|nr:glycosyltransferase family 2 protein [Prevotellaceae bacterium]
MKALTVFTPTYNRKHTLSRTFDSLCHQTCRDFEWLIIDDGSTDGTKEWVKGLGIKVQEQKQRYDWMGRLTEEQVGESFIISVNVRDDMPPFVIHYVYKENGGLYTGYNVAYSYIETELCVCIDSDDYMPSDAVEKILKHWNERPRNKEFCGLLGLDFNVVDCNPIGGWFPEEISEAYQIEIPHRGDTKQVMRTDLMRLVAPQIGFRGEKDFNPFYMLMQILDKYPILVVNENFCWVEYQIGADSMSQGIWRQYRRSPRSYSKYRISEMKLQHGNSWTRKFLLCIHYVSSCIFSKDKNWLNNTPLKGLTLCAIPFGVVLALFVLWKNRFYT